MIELTSNATPLTISERIDSMLLLGATESDDITPVLNERYDEVVLVPSDRLPSLNLTLCADTNLLIIDHHDYSDIADDLDIQDQGEDITRTYFTNRLRRVTGYGTAWISREGWGRIFDHLKDGGMTIQAMLKDISRVANSFQEQNVTDILSDNDVDHKSMTAEEKLEAATAIIHSNDRMLFLASYDIEGVMEAQILYSEG